jgi:hypothetical protein
MKIKTDTEFISFSDGVCDIYTVDDAGEKTDKYPALCFSNRVLGFKRYYAAAANQAQINRVIRVPQISGIEIHDTAEISGVGKYDIDLVQYIYDTNPPCIDLTLRQLEMFEVTL